MRNFVAFSLCCLIGSVFADCEFSIINYTSYPVSAKVGFYGSVESSVIVPGTDNRVIKIKSDYRCNEVNALGMGRAFIMFPKDPNGAGANYSYANHQISLMGKFTGMENGRPLVSDNGHPVWLNYTGNAITSERFELKLNFVSRPNTFSAGTE